MEVYISELNDNLSKKVEKGYVDFIFYPEVDKNTDAIILELKVEIL